MKCDRGRVLAEAVFIELTEVVCKVWQRPCSSKCDGGQAVIYKTRQDLFYSAQFYRTFRLKLHRQLNTVQLRNKRKKKNVTIN